MARATVPTAPMEASELLSNGSCVARSGTRWKESALARKRLWEPLAKLHRPKGKAVAPNHRSVAQSSPGSAGISTKREKVSKGFAESSAGKPAHHGNRKLWGAREWQ